MGVMFAFAILGAVDDWEGIHGKRKGDGMRARTKFMVQVVLALVTAYALKYVIDAPDLYLPGFFFEIEIGWIYVPIAAFIIVAESNAVNFTDGLDGLAGLIAATAIAAFGGIALMQEQVYLARFCFILVGALFGFLWFNVHPAQLIMGDTGSMALGFRAGGHRADDRAMAHAAGHWHHSIGRNVERGHSDRLLPLDGRQTLLQNDAHPSSL
jgi:phospho-N-acetylmuramoyl-pentapeptide-transferase